MIKNVDSRGSNGPGLLEMYTCTSIRRDGVYIYIYIYIQRCLTYHQPAPLIPPSLVSSRLLPSPTGTTSLLLPPPPSRHAIPHLRRETPPLRQALNPTQQELQLAIGRARRILRHHVATQTNLDKGQPPLRMGGAENAGAGQRGRTRFGVIGDEELVRRRGPETLGAVPRHVLDHEESAVGDEDVVEEAVADDDVVGAGDDGGEDGEAGGRGGVGAVDEDVGRGAFGPVGVGWGVDGGLHVAAVEVDGRAGREVVEGSREAEDVPEEGAGGGDLVDVDWVSCWLEWEE